MTLRVLFVTTGLGAGGAETQLLQLLEHAKARLDDALVVSLLDSTSGLKARFIEAGVRVETLGASRLLTLPACLAKLGRLVREFRPTVIQGWMYHGNLAAVMARALSSERAVLVWGIRQGVYSSAPEKPINRVLLRVSAAFSRRVDAIVYNSEAAKEQHEQSGFVRGEPETSEGEASDGETRHAVYARGNRTPRSVVLENGLDPERYRPDARAYREVRSELGIPPNALLIGYIARYHPIKGHTVFFSAAKSLAARHRDLYFLCAGEGMAAENPALRGYLDAPSLASRVRLLGFRRDVPRLVAALDIACSCSFGESWPNAVGEALCCAVPVVATDVGDVRRIVGDAGCVVPAGDATAFASACSRLLEEPQLRARLGAAGRERMKQRFSASAMAEKYVALYRALLAARSGIG